MTKTTHLGAAQAAYHSKDYAGAVAASEAGLTNPDATPPSQLSALLDVRASALYNLHLFIEAADARADQIKHEADSGAHPIKLAGLRYRRAWALYQTGSYDEAMKDAGASYLANEEHLGADAPETLNSLRICILALRRMGHFGEVLSLAQELVARTPPNTDDAEEARKLLASATARDQVTSSPQEAAHTGAKPVHRQGSADAAAAKRQSPSRAAEIIHAIASGTSRGIARGVIESLLG